MRFELSASGLAEDRDDQAYAAALTYALVYGAAEGGTPNPNEGTPNPTRREQFTVDIYTRVSAVPVARSSVRGQIPSGERCDNASRAANSTGSLTVELGLVARVPF